MKIENSIIILEDVVGYSPSEVGVTYTDSSYTRVFIPIEVLVRLHDGSKFYMENKVGVNWDQFCDNLFKGES